jgi:hypothetical protein
VADGSDYLGVSLAVLVSFNDVTRTVGIAKYKTVLQNDGANIRKA